MRRNGHPLYGARYCANSNPLSREVHDVDNEKDECEIDIIIAAGHAKPMHSIEDVSLEGYSQCRWCMGGK